MIIVCPDWQTQPTGDWARNLTLPRDEVNTLVDDLEKPIEVEGTVAWIEDRQRCDVSRRLGPVSMKEQCVQGG